MEYAELSKLVEKFKNDKYIIKAYNKIYECNGCRLFRTLKTEDIENTNILEKLGFEKGDDGACMNTKEVNSIMDVINETVCNYTNETLQRYSKHNNDLVSIYNEINECSDTCELIDATLSKHKKDISFISKDINTIQEITETMNDKLKNRRVTLELLNTYIKIILITPKLIYDICKGEINDEFIMNVRILTKKIENCKHCLYDTYPSIRYSYIELEKLKSKAIDRIFQFYLQKFYDIKNKKMNIHLIQQNLLKYCELTLFLYNNNKNVYNYLIKEYITIMSRVYLNLFKRYIEDLEKKKIEFGNDTLVGFINFEKNENGNTVVTLQSAKNTMMNILGFQVSSNKNYKKENGFLLNQRTQIIEDINYFHEKKETTTSTQQKGIIPIIVTTDTSQYYYEEIYKSIHKLFLDTGTAEYMFIVKFLKNIENHDFLFLEIYSKTITTCFDSVYSFLSTSFDFIALFCMYMINLDNAYIMKLRNILSLHEYIEKVQHLLWNRILLILDQNIKSLNYQNYVMNDITKHTSKGGGIYNLIYTNTTNPTSTIPTKNHYNNHNHAEISKLPIYDTSYKNTEHVINSKKEELHQNQNETEIKIEKEKNHVEMIGKTVNTSTTTNSPVKTQTHLITKKFSEFYVSLLVLSKLSYEMETYYMKQSNEQGFEITKWLHMKKKSVYNRKNESVDCSVKGVHLNDHKINESTNSKTDSTKEEDYKPEEKSNEEGFTKKESEVTKESITKDITEDEINELMKKELEQKYNNLQNYISTLEKSMMEALYHLSNEFTNPIEKNQFIINNYYHIIHTMKGIEIEEEKITSFEKILEEEILVFVESELKHYIKDLIEFVTTHEKIINECNEEKENETSLLSKIDVQRMEHIAVTFTKEWKQLLKEIRHHIIHSFSNFTNCSNILKKLNTQILLYYTRYHELIKKIYYDPEKKPPEVLQNIPSVNLLLAQIKKDTKNVET